MTLTQTLEPKQLLNIDPKLDDYTLYTSVTVKDLTVEGNRLLSKIKSGDFDRSIYINPNQVILHGFPHQLMRDYFKNDYYEIIPHARYELLGALLACLISEDIKEHYPDACKIFTDVIKEPTDQSLEFIERIIRLDNEKYVAFVEETLMNTKNRIEGWKVTKHKALQVAFEDALATKTEIENKIRTGNPESIHFSDLKADDLEDEELFEPYLKRGASYVKYAAIYSRYGRNFLMAIGIELLALVIVHSWLALLGILITVPAYAVFILWHVVINAVSQKLSSDDKRLKQMLHYIKKFEDTQIPATKLTWSKAFEQYCANENIVATGIDRAFAVLYFKEEYKTADALKAKLKVESGNREAQLDALVAFVTAHSPILKERTDAIYTKARKRLDIDEQTKAGVDDAFRKDLESLSKKNDSSDDIKL